MAGAAAVLLSREISRRACKPLGPLDRLANHLRAFIGRLEAGLTDAGLMQEDVPLRTTGRFDETIAFRQIEPFDLTDHFLGGFCYSGRSRYTRFHPSPHTLDGKNKVNTSNRDREVKLSRTYHIFSI